MKDEVRERRGGKEDLESEKATEKMREKEAD